MEEEIVGQDSLQHSAERREELRGAARRALIAAGAVGLVLTGMALAPMVVAGRAPVADPVVTASIEPMPAVAPTPSAADLARQDAIALRVAATRSADLGGLEESITALERVLPRQRGRGIDATENELGLAKRLLGQANKDAMLLGDAVEHYRRALSGFEAAADPAAATTVRWNLAIALRLFGETADNDAMLREAASLLRDMLSDKEAEFDREAAQRNLGTLLLALANTDNDTSLYGEAAEALQAALVDAGSDDRPRVEWAETQNALANALEALGEREWSLARLEAALKARRNAWVLYQSAGLDTYQFYFDTRIAAIEQMIAARRSAPLGAGTSATPNT